MLFYYILGILPIWIIETNTDINIYESKESESDIPANIN